MAAPAPAAGVVDGSLSQRGGAARPNVFGRRQILRREFLFFHHLGDRLYPSDGPRHRASSAHLVCGQPLRSGRPFDECRNREKNAPLTRDGAGHRVRRYLAQCPKRTTQTETPLQSARVFRETVRFEPRFLRQGPFFTAIFGRMSLFCCNFRHNAFSSRQYLTQFQLLNAFSASPCIKSEKRAQAQAVTMPPIVGRNARLPAYSPDTMLGRARSLG